MKKLLSFAIVMMMIATVALTGCEQKSDAEKTMDSMKKDMKAMTN